MVNGEHCNSVWYSLLTSKLMSFRGLSSIHYFELNGKFYKIQVTLFRFAYTSRSDDQRKCCLRDPGDYSVSFCVSVKYDARQSRIENNYSNRQQHCQDRSRTASNTCCVKGVQGGICRSNKSLRLASKKCVCCLIPILFT